MLHMASDLAGSGENGNELPGSIKSCGISWLDFLRTTFIILATDIQKYRSAMIAQSV
jgi:hypothetical protein